MGGGGDGVDRRLEPDLKVYHIAHIRYIFVGPMHGELNPETGAELSAEPDTRRKKQICFFKRVRGKQGIPVELGEDSGSKRYWEQWPPP